MWSKCKTSINEQKCWWNPGVAVQIAIRNTQRLKTMGSLNNGQLSRKPFCKHSRSAPRRETSNHCYFPLSIHSCAPPYFHLRSVTHASIHLFIWLAIHPYGWTSILSHTHTCNHNMMFILNLTSLQPVVSLRADVLLLWQTLWNQTGFFLNLSTGAFVLFNHTLANMFLF